MSQPGGSRPKGRPKLRWKDQVAEDAPRAGCRNWKRTAHNREDWRKLLKEAKTHPGCSATGGGGGLNNSVCVLLFLNSHDYIQHFAFISPTRPAASSFAGAPRGHTRSRLVYGQAQFPGVLKQRGLYFPPGHELPEMCLKQSSYFLTTSKTYDVI
jgi:hypothetical protein